MNWKIAIGLFVLLFSIISIESSLSSGVSANPGVHLAASGFNYYVSDTGNDTNPGTLEAPWKTIQKAANEAVPGTTIFVRKGIYHELVHLHKSGSVSAGYITFRSYPGETAILDGKGLQVSDNGLFSMDNISYVRIQGFEIRNYRTSVSGLTPMGIRISGAGGFIEIKNNYIHHIETLYTGNSGGDAHGIAVYGTAAPESIHDIVIKGNNVSNLRLGSSEAIAINGNVEHFEVSNNEVHDSNNIGIVVIGFEGISPVPQYDRARNGVIRGNRVYHISSYGNPAYGNQYAAGGIYVDGGKDIVIEGNSTHHNDIGIELASEHKGGSTSNVTARSNLIYDNNVSGIVLGGYDDQRGYTAHCIIVNNTVFRNDLKEEGGGQIALSYDTRFNIVQNNIVYANTSGILLTNAYVENAGNQIDYNIYYSASVLNQTSWQWKNETYIGFEKYRSATGNDVHSMFTDPNFVDPKTPDLHLKPFSLSMNRGLRVPNLGDFDFEGNDRIQGAAVDIGAFESNAGSTQNEGRINKIVLKINSTTAFVNDKKYSLSVAPTLIGSTTLLPLRFVTEALGAHLAWNKEEKRISLTLIQSTVVIWIDKNEAKVNGDTVKMAVPAQIVAGNTLVPLRFISENLKQDVTYNKTTREIVIKGNFRM